MEDMNNTIIQLNLIDLSRTFLPTTAKYKLFSSTHRTSVKTDDILDHKINLKILNVLKSYKACSPITI